MIGDNYSHAPRLVWCLKYCGQDYATAALLACVSQILQDLLGGIIHNVYTLDTHETQIACALGQPPPSMSWVIGQSSAIILGQITLIKEPWPLLNTECQKVLRQRRFAMISPHTLSCKHMPHTNVAG